MLADGPLGRRRLGILSATAPFGLALLLGLGAVCGVLWSMRAPGPGLDPDSMSYLAAAESLADAGELRVPFNEWSSRESTARLCDFPPGFPIAIAALEKAGVPSERGATWVEAASAFATVAGSTLLVSAATVPSAGAVAAVAVLVTPALVEDHYVVMSEPLFLALLVAILGLAATERPRAYALGVVAGAAAMVRYAGLALLLAAAARSALAPGTQRRRVVAAVLASAPGVLALLLWTAGRAECGSMVEGRFRRDSLGGMGHASTLARAHGVAFFGPRDLAIAVLGGLAALVARGANVARGLPPKGSGCSCEWSHRRELCHAGNVLAALCRRRDPVRQPDRLAAVSSRHARGGDGACRPVANLASELRMRSPCGVLWCVGRLSSRFASCGSRRQRVGIREH